MVDYGEHYNNLNKLTVVAKCVKSTERLKPVHELQHCFKTDFTKFVNGIKGDLIEIADCKKGMLNTLRLMSDNVREEHPDDILTFTELLKEIAELQNQEGIL